MAISFIHEIEDCSCIYCPNLNNPQKKFFINIILTFLSSSGFLLILLGCSLWTNGWWSSFVLLPLILAGVPDFLFNRIRRQSNSSDTYVSTYTDPSQNNRKCRCLSFFQDWWFILAGFFGGTAFPCLIITLWHNDIIYKNTLALNISGTFLIGISMFIFVKLIYNKYQFRFLNTDTELDDLNIDDFSDDEDLLNLNKTDE